VFIPTIGEFVTPSLVGGPGGFMFGNAIAGQFTSGIDWQKGSVLSIFLLFSVLLLISVMGRFVQLRNVRVA
jgi:spermidine/putrescine transport system permease protein